MNDAIINLVHAMDAENPDRICNFCLEPRSECRRLGSYHSQIIGLDDEKR